MSYGVNKQWAAPRSRARAAGKRKRKTTRTVKRSRRASARPARKKSRAKKPRAVKQKKPRARKARAKKTKAPKRKKYTRYDPETGRKVSVYDDDYRFDEWPERKPSKSSKLAAKIREHPVDYALDRATKVATSRGRTLARASTKRLGGLVAGGAGAAAAVGAVAASAAILAAAYVVAEHIARSGRLKLGEKINAISQRFVLAQQEIERKLGVKTWAAVPQEIRAKWVSDYKHAISVANSQAQGSAFAGVRETGSYK